jgi:hypothetical protein
MAASGKDAEPNREPLDEIKDRDQDKLEQEQAVAPLDAALSGGDNASVSASITTTPGPKTARACARRTRARGSRSVVLMPGISGGVVDIATHSQFGPSVHAHSVSTLTRDEAGRFVASGASSLYAEPQSECSSAW